MSACQVQIKEGVPQKNFTRSCPTCSLKIENQFLTKCPRCGTSLSLAELCTGCFQNGACHTEMIKPAKAPKASFSFTSLFNLTGKIK